MSFTAFAAELLELWRPALRGSAADAAVPRTANVAVFRSADSTNLSARRIVAEFAADDAEPPSTWLFAYEQTKGRGRQGRTWVSPGGAGVYATLLVPGLPGPILERLPLAVAVALAGAVEELAGAPCRIKWPNDLLLAGRKVGGILIESVRRGDEPAAAICGFGVNVTQTADQLPSGATSLGMEQGARRAARPDLAAAQEIPSLAAVACRLADATAAGLHDLLSDAATGADLAARFRALSAHAEGDTLRCSMGGEIVEGRVVQFDERGFLCLRTAGGERWLSAGEVIEP